MANLCSAYLGNKGFSLPRFGSKRDQTDGKQKTKQDELYGFLPEEKNNLHRTGTLPGRTKPGLEQTQQRRSAQKPTRRSLLPCERKRVMNMINAKKQAPLEVQIPKEDGWFQFDMMRNNTTLAQSLSPPAQQQKQLPQQHQNQQNQIQKPQEQQQQQNQQKPCLSPKTPLGMVSPKCQQRLNTSLNSSGNSLNDSGIDSGLDSCRRTDSSRVSFSSCGSVNPRAAQLSEAVYGINWQLQHASMSKPANIPMWVSRDFAAPTNRTKQNVISVEKGAVVNALYRTNEWVFVRTAQSLNGFIPYHCVEPLGLRRLSRDFTQQHPELGPPLWRPLCDSTVSKTGSVCPSDLGYQSSQQSLQKSPCGRASICESDLPDTRLFKPIARKYDPDLSVLEDCANVQYLRSLEPRLARDRNPVFMSSQLSMVPHIGSDISNEEDLQSVNSLDVSIDSTCTESSVFTVTDSGVQLTVLFDYTGEEEDDLCVQKGDIVIELNADDPEWTYVRNDEGDEGFIPSTYAVNLRKLNLDPRAPTTYL